MSQPDSYCLNAIKRLRAIVHDSLDKDKKFNPELVKDKLSYMFACHATSMGIKRGLFTELELHKQLGFEYAQDKKEDSPLPAIPTESSDDSEVTVQ